MLLASLGSLNDFKMVRDCRVENPKSQGNLKFIDKDGERCALQNILLRVSLT